MRIYEDLLTVTMRIYDGYVNQSLGVLASVFGAGSPSFRR